MDNDEISSDLVVYRLQKFVGIIYRGAEAIDL
jgi:hypothetical protein